MVKRIGSSIRKTRHKYRKSFREKGKLSLNAFFQSFDAGQKVCLKTNPSIQKGRFHPRFHGKIGVIKEKIGRCYLVSVRDKGKEKLLQVHPVHLKAI